jgi:two-component system, cell cycle response regulator
MQPSSKRLATAPGRGAGDDTMDLKPVEVPRRCRVLVVDDDELVRAQLSALLRVGGYDVVAAGSGEEAIRALATRDCQMVLTDWQMPDMDGLALCRQLRLEHTESYVYVLMLTVRSRKSDILAGLAAGVDDYVVKGASAEELLARLQVGRRITRLEQSLRKSTRENRRLAVTDALTGARNRRYLTEYLNRELERSRRYDRPLAILACDIDGFKTVNDRLGHEAGDEVLRAFVGRAASCLRSDSDWIARLGGDEFVVVLPETMLVAAAGVGDKLRMVLKEKPISTFGGPVTATVSIGVSAIQTAQELAATSAIELMRAADRGLYSAKSSGKDQTTAVSVAAGEPVVAHLRSREPRELN